MKQKYMLLFLCAIPPQKVNITKLAAYLGHRKTEVDDYVSLRFSLLLTDQFLHMTSQSHD